VPVPVPVPAAPVAAAWLVVDRADGRLCAADGGAMLGLEGRGEGETRVSVLLSFLLFQQGMQARAHTGYTFRKRVESTVGTEQSAACVLRASVARGRASGCMQVSTDLEVSGVCLASAEEVVFAEPEGQPHEEVDERGDRAPRELHKQPHNKLSHARDHAAVVAKREAEAQRVPPPHPRE
jgi:hypothetical protein